MALHSNLPVLHPEALNRQQQITKKNNAHHPGSLTFAPDLVSRPAGMKREVRCKSGAIPVAVRASLSSGRK